ncbi:MAG TPA: cellulase family glycosylhydrolase [Ignavibacteriaceae bacterium]|nr:cellulase family glycosylhydrolase [Ignavibacteriaceae bacterium]
MKFKFCSLKTTAIMFNKPSTTFLLLGLFLNEPIYPQLPTASEIASEMTIGWNTVNSLEVPTKETDWGNPLINQQLIDSVSKAGFNTIRIPCAWNSHADQTTLEIDADFLARVKEVIDYCYANNLYVIINCHWDGGWLENNVTEAMQDTNNVKQEAYWTQIAEYFKDYDEHLLFAGANEPNVNNAAQMAVLMSYHQTFINAVRATGGNNSSRVLIIQGPSTDIDKTNQLMSSMPADSIEDRLMAEIHYYTPWQFCGLEQDANWGKMFYFWGNGYHSSTNPARNATWGEEASVETYFQSMKTKFVDNGIPVILGEYGAIKRTSLTGEDLTLHIASREHYFNYVTNSAVRHGLIPFCWDNGLFNRNNGAVIDQGTLDAVIQGAVTTIEEEKKTENSSINYMNVSPNPVSSSTNIQVFLKEAARVNISIFNILGEEVAVFNDLDYGPGTHSLRWDTNNLPEGAYFINLNIGSHRLIRKVLLIR